MIILDVVTTAVYRHLSPQHPARVCQIYTGDGRDRSYLTPGGSFVMLYALHGRGGRGWRLRYRYNRTGD